MVRFLKYILSILHKRNSCNVSVTVTKFVVKKVVNIKEKDSTSSPTKPE